MAYMSDEKYEFIQDVKDKRFTARSAKNRRGHAGKGGPMKTASDFMSKAQLQALNGAVKTYRLGSPMSWNDFSEMPDDLKVEYVKKLRKKFNVPDEELAVAMGVDISTLSEMLTKLKLSPRIGNPDWYDTDDHGRFQTWWIITEEEEK